MTNKMKNKKVSFTCSFLYFICSMLLLISCKKSSDTFSTQTLNDYYPLQTGKYITYQLDSLVYISFGTRDSVITNELKYQVDSLITDNTGRPAYRVFRLIRKNQQDAWRPEATFMVLNTGTNIEFVEDNLKYIKMTLPIRNDKSWKGNSYLSNYIMNNPSYNYLDNWDYTYSNVGEQEVVGNYTLANTLTINQRNEIDGLPDNPDAYSEIVFSQEKYAQGIGMVYKKFFRKEYQPNSNGTGGNVADGSYGVEYTMIDHN